jgi:hypothetical protein
VSRYRDRTNIYERPAETIWILPIKPTEFEYHRPERAADVVALLTKHENAVIVAGNQTPGGRVLRGMPLVPGEARFYRPALRQSRSPGHPPGRHSEDRI